MHLGTLRQKENSNAWSGCIHQYQVELQVLPDGVNHCFPSRMHTEMLNSLPEIGDSPATCRIDLDKETPVLPSSSGSWKTHLTRTVEFLWTLRRPLANEIDKIPLLHPIPERLKLITSLLSPNLLIIIAARDGVGHTTLQFVIKISMLRFYGVGQRVYRQPKTPPFRTLPYWHSTSDQMGPNYYYYCRCNDSNCNNWDLNNARVF
ncbi:hypothetical protein Pint_19637 [Pistacia integerrima]|uniref:Uncharacterized protein n=1 Tax=Pistacia integerrima TaxID=434235 RepID=A0ACC0XDV7_9ROSI|nr:hypothetical protein Pint_19637 [Pistacia integerrima]